jgi:hypothetical protein
MTFLPGNIAGLVVASYLLCSDQALAMDKNAVVKKATAAYYSLEQHGFKSFQCTAVPDWPDFFEQKLEGYSEAAVKEKISKVRFSVSVNESGMLDLKPYSEGGEAIKGSTSLMVGKLADLLAGFLQVIQMNVIQTPFSLLNTDFTLTEKADEYVIDMNDQDAKSALSLTEHAPACSPG